MQIPVPPPPNSLFSSTTSMEACTRYWKWRSVSLWGAAVFRYRGKFYRERGREIRAEKIT